MIVQYCPYILNASVKAPFFLLLCYHIWYTIVHNVLSLVRGTMPYKQISRNCSHFVAETFYLLNGNTLFLLPPVPDHHHTLLCFSELDYFGYCTIVKFCSIIPSVTGLFYLDSILHAHPCYWTWKDFLIFQGWIICHCEYIPHFYYTSIHRHLDSFT